MAKIVHISDLHISEHILRGPHHDPRGPHRYGHDVGAFLALDAFLKSFDWDLLVITGDVSRVGNIESFEGIRNWLENEIVFAEIRIGLNLSKSESRHYVVIPGNHDRFNGGLTQGSLDNYHQEFPVVRAGTMETFTIEEITINIHMFDSTWEDGGFAYGRVDQRSLVPKRLREDHIDLAILHHHFLQPPRHRREITTELMNSTEVAAYMLNSGFDGVLFGHTHKGYIGRSSVNVLSGLLNDHRKQPRFWSKFFPKFLLRNNDDDNLVAYKREKARNGQFPTLESFFNYLYLRGKGFKLRGPSAFENIKGFHDQMKKATSDAGIAGEIANARKKQVLISLAPSACQAEAKWNGLHVIDIKKGSDSKVTFEWDRYQLDGAQFCVKPRDIHLA